MANARRSAGRIKAYELLEETVSAPAALSLDVYTSKLAVDGTDAHTVAAPKFAGQWKYIFTLSAANTPVSTVAVSSCRMGGTTGTRTFAGFGTTGATAPKSLELYSPDGLVWDVHSMVGVTVS